MLQNPVSSYKRSASHSAEQEKKFPSSFYPLVSLCVQTIPSWAFRQGDSAGDRLVLTPTPTKGLRRSGGRTEDSSLAAAPAPAGSSASQYLKNTAGEKRKRGEGKRENIKEEMVGEKRRKGKKKKSCSAVIRWFRAHSCGGAICWGKERPSAVQTLKPDPLRFH